MPPPTNIAPPTPIEPEDHPVVTLDGSDPTVDTWEHFLGQTIVRNVTQAKLHPVLPSPENDNGKAVIVLPGGGYQFLAVENEGFPVAEKLAADGYRAFVLLYNTNPTPTEPADFLAEAGKVFASLGKKPLPENADAVADLVAAVDHLTSGDHDHRVAPADLGLIGFSAGSRTVLGALPQVSAAMPLDHIALIYPAAGKDVPTIGTRTFMAIAADDPLFAAGGIEFVTGLLANGTPLEFHLYANGDHGFGLMRDEITAAAWYDHYRNWLTWS